MTVQKYLRGALAEYKNNKRVGANAPATGVVTGSRWDLAPSETGLQRTGSAAVRCRPACLRNLLNKYRFEDSFVDYY